jgi:hypothetical protein
MAGDMAYNGVFDDIYNILFLSIIAMFFPSIPYSPLSGQFLKYRLRPNYKCGEKRDAAHESYYRQQSFSVYFYDHN